MKKDFSYYIENKNNIVWKFFFGMGILSSLITFFINSKLNIMGSSTAKVKIGILEIYKKM